MGNPSSNVLIKDVIQDAVPVIWEQLINCYRYHLERDEWVDSNNSDGGNLSNCEALMSLFLLLKNFPDELTEDSSASDKTAATCIVKTVLKLFKDGKSFDETLNDATPYINPSLNSAFLSIPGPYTESLYMTGNVLI